MLSVQDAIESRRVRMVGHRLIDDSALNLLEARDLWSVLALLWEEALRGLVVDAQLQLHAIEVEACLLVQIEICHCFAELLLGHRRSAVLLLLINVVWVLLGDPVSEGGLAAGQVPLVADSSNGMTALVDSDRLQRSLLRVAVPLGVELKPQRRLVTLSEHELLARLSGRQRPAGLQHRLRAAGAGLVGRRGQ